jgi:hypothetical protein
LYEFEGFNRFEIPLEVGDRIKIEEEIKGWYKGKPTIFSACIYAKRLRD